MSEITLSKNAQSILDSVKELTVLELADLVKAMEEEFGVSAAAPVAAVAAAGGAVAEEGPSTVDVVLVDPGAGKINVIKVVREITGLGLKEAKTLVDEKGKVKEGVDKAEGEELKAKLEEAGATIELA
ncbi:MAG: 50S ribosomal protein L7/L12 [Patescibacteria group bacterium]|nr:50S ribosomal protein L7/L12 [Patescibacteria group bacterium]